MKRLIVFLFFAFSLLPIQAHAIYATVDDTVILSEVLDDDVYSIGRKIMTTGIIGGDLIIAGQVLDVVSPVSDDVIAAGQMLDIEGDVGDDLRLIGQKISIESIVGDSVTAFGQDITLKKGSEVKGDFWAFGETVVINGEVHGDVLIDANQVIINAPINGNAKIKVTSKIQMGENGKIDGNLNLTALENINANLVGGEATFTYLEKFKGAELEDKNIIKIIAGLFVGMFFLKYFGLLAIAILLILIIKNYILVFVKTGKKDWLVNTGIGFAIFFLAPVLGILLLISIIGIPLAALLFLSYIALLIVAKLLIGFLVGHLMIPINSKSSFGRILSSFALGLFVFMILSLIPILGWIAHFILFLIALGAISRLEWDFLKLLRKSKKL